MSKGTERTEPPDGLWEKCQHCHEIVFRRDFMANQNVCPNCQFHYDLPVEDRIRFLLDTGTFAEADTTLKTTNPLKFTDSKPYSDRIEAMFSRTQRWDACVSGSGLLLGHAVHLAVFDFSFMGGSMGSVVGEKIARVFLRAAETRAPAIVVTASGGARMQEGLFSLMQMAKTCAALGRLKESGTPFFSILTHPTTGGVAASFGLLGDVNIAEPGALIGFAGPRVIQQTIREKLPDGFQRSEYLLEHGMVDMICSRDNLRPALGQLLDLTANRKGAFASAAKK